jgi:ribose-phosphate pyrophosphokinase
MNSNSIVLHAFAEDAQPAKALADALGISWDLVGLHRFPDGELLPTVPPAAATTIVYMSLAHPNEKLVALLLGCDAWRRSGAQRLILVAPYLCYLRQDAVFAPGQPISQAVIGRLLGDRFDRIVTVDAHLHRTSSLSAVFPQTCATDLSAAVLIAGWLRENAPALDFIAGPDVESEPWVRQVADTLKVEYRLFSKTRLGPSQVHLTLAESGGIAGRKVALVDDICSSGATLIQSAEILKAAGADKIVACVTHALFDAAAESRLRAAGVSSIVSTDSVAHPSNAMSLATLLTDALRSEMIS